MVGKSVRPHTLYGSGQTFNSDESTIDTDTRYLLGNKMLHHQFEAELAHLEYVIPLLESDSPPLGLRYWRRRITSLSVHQRLLSDGKTRVARLLMLFDEIERPSA
jgi:hypothetical protein